MFKRTHFRNLLWGSNLRIVRKQRIRSLEPEEKSQATLSRESKQEMPGPGLGEVREVM